MRLSFIITAVTTIVLILGCKETPDQQSKPSDKNEVNTENISTESDSGKVEKIVYGDKFPEVLAAKVKQRKDNQWTFSVTLSSTYDSPKRYADAWRVLDEEGKELGIRILGHDHANEQPFTRSGTVKVPKDLKTVFVEGRDQANGWSGQRFKVKMPER